MSGWTRRSPSSWKTWPATAPRKPGWSSPPRTRRPSCAGACGPACCGSSRRGGHQGRPIPPGSRMGGHQGRPISVGFRMGGHKGRPYMMCPMTTPVPSWTAAVRREVLPNGLTLLVQRDRSAPVAAVVTHVKAGFFDEPDAWTGISHVLEHMFFKGTPTRGVGQIARETKSAGGYLNASTTYDHTSYYVVLPAARLAEAIAVQSDALMHAAIDAGELARELQVIIQEAKRKLDHPGAVTAETLHEVMYDHHRIRRWRIGYEQQLAGFTRADVHGYYASRYVPSRTIVAIVGDIEEEDALRLGRAA